MATKRQGLWVTPTTFVEFAENGQSISQEIATRDKAWNFYAISMYLPNPDPVLKKLGKDIQVYRDMLSDAHIASCVEQRQAGASSMQWEIDRGQSKSRQSKFVQQIFDRLDMDRIITELLNASLYGYQPVEVMWQADGASWTIGDLVGKPPEWFVYNDRNELRFRTKSNPMYGDEIPPMKIAVARHRSSYENPYGVAALSPCFWPLTFKKGGWKYWAKFTEKFGMPWVLGKHRRGASVEEKNNMLDMLERMVQDAIAVIPEDASVDTLEPKSGAASVDIYKGLLEFCNAEMSKALIGQTLTTEVVGNGSYAASKTHGDVRAEIVDSDKRMVEAAMNEVIKWVIEVNFGENVEAPKFILYQEEEVDLTLSERDKNLEAGGRVKLTKTYYQRAYGFEDDELDVTEPPPPAPVPGPGDAPGAAMDAQPEMPGTKAAAEFAEGGAGSPQRPIDALIQQADDQATIDDLMAPVEKLLAESASLDEFRDKLLTLYQDMDARSLGAVMEKALTAADLMGRFEVKKEAGIRG